MAQRSVEAAKSHPSLWRPIQQCTKQHGGWVLQMTTTWALSCTRMHPMKSFQAWHQKDGLIMVGSYVVLSLFRSHMYMYTLKKVKTWRMMCSFSFLHALCICVCVCVCVCVSEHNTHTHTHMRTHETRAPPFICIFHPHGAHGNLRPGKVHSAALLCTKP